MSGTLGRPDWDKRLAALESGLADVQRSIRRRDTPAFHQLSDTDASRAVDGEVPTWRKASGAWVPEVPYSIATLVDVKGDILVATGADTLVRFGTGGSGADGRVLTARSSATEGVAWEAGLTFEAAVHDGAVTQVTTVTPTLDILAPVINSSHGAAALQLNRSGGEAVVHIYNRRRTDGTFGDAPTSLSTAGHTQLAIEGGQRSTASYSDAHLLVYNHSTAGVDGRPVIALEGSGFARQLVGHNGSNELRVRNSDDTAYAPIAASAFNVNSTENAKRQIRVLDVPLLARLRSMPVVQFRRPVEDPHTDEAPPASLGRNRGQDRIGVMANDIAAHLPEAAAWESNGERTGVVNGGWDVAVMAAAVLGGLQELADEVDRLKAENAELREHLPPR